ncbi:MAG: hypothetical protein QXR62_04550 [Candidatus Bathyarchaeia archaeon]
MAASRVLRTGGLYFDGRNDCVVVGLQPDGSGRPFTVYGWSEITIAEWIYIIKPKPNTFYSRFSAIGDPAADYPCTSHWAENAYDYSFVYASWMVRRPDGTPREYLYNWISEANRWVHIVRRFTANREFSVWVNAVKKYSVIVPSNEKTVLEWNPDAATYPILYKRFALGVSTTLAGFMSLMNDEVCIYNRALTDAEIYEIYSKGTFIKDGLVLYLPFHEGEGNIAHDVSGYGNHGTIYGGAMWVVKKALVR